MFRTLVADALTIVRSAVMPGRRAAGAPVRVTMTGNDTTLVDPEELPAAGAIDETVPWIAASIAPTLTVASCPTCIDATSLSTTSAVTSYVADASVSTVPVLSRPGVTLTAVTVPSTG